MASFNLSQMVYYSKTLLYTQNNIQSNNCEGKSKEKTPKPGMGVWRKLNYNYPLRNHKTTCCICKIHCDENF